jgi:hypothetical protein
VRLVNTIPFRGATAPTAAKRRGQRDADRRGLNFMIQDGGFELGEPSPWTQTSTNFGAPDLRHCDQGADRHLTAWFGGISRPKPAP